jgi:peptidoglycan/xylan/chitin deacetylase (PgdA/CDA1 family)
VTRTRPLVLAYHGLLELPRELDPHNLMVAPDAFVAQVARLARRGYRFVGLSELARRLRTGADLRGLCALTFDDGTSELASVLPELLPGLDAHATLFVCPGLLGAPHPDMPAAAGVRLMDRAELRAMAAHDRIELGSHTHRHVSLADADADSAYREMATSKAALEELTDATVETFAYPRCAYSAACPAAAERAGYLAAVTCGPRGGLSPGELARESIDRLDGRLSFGLKSRGWFWPLWSSPPGRLTRRLTRRRRHG